MPWCVAQIHPPRLVLNSPSFWKCWQSIFSTESPSRPSLVKEGPRWDFALSDKAVPTYKSPAPFHQFGSIPSSRAPLGLSLHFCCHYTTVKLLLLSPASFTPLPQVLILRAFHPKILPACKSSSQNLPPRKSDQRSTVPWLRGWALESYWGWILATLLSSCVPLGKLLFKSLSRQIFFKK